MVCRVAALPWTSPSPSWRSSAGEEVLHVRNEAPQHLDDQLGTAPKRPTISPRTPRPVRPRPLPLPARPWRRSPRRRAGQAPRRSLSIGFATLVVHARRADAVGQRGVGGHGGIGGPASARRRGFSGSPPRPSISGICMSISTARVERHARLQHLLNARQPAVGEARRRPRCSTARRRLAVQRVVLHYQQTRTPTNRWVRSTGRGGGLAGAPCSPCNACSTESASCLSVTGLIEKIDEGRRAVVARIGQHLAADPVLDHHGRRQVAPATGGSVAPR